MKTGTCKFCGYTPVAFDAERCPQCNGLWPNPGMGQKLSWVFGIIIFLLMLPCLLSCLGAL